MTMNANDDSHIDLWRQGVITYDDLLNDFNALNGTHNPFVLEIFKKPTEETFPIGCQLLRDTSNYLLLFFYGKLLFHNVKKKNQAWIETIWPSYEQGVLHNIAHAILLRRQRYHPEPIAALLLSILEMIPERHQPILDRLILDTLYSQKCFASLTSQDVMLIKTHERLTRLSWVLGCQTPSRKKDKEWLAHFQWLGYVYANNVEKDAPLTEETSLFLS